MTEKDLSDYPRSEGDMSRSEGSLAQDLDYADVARLGRVLAEHVRLWCLLLVTDAA